MPINVSSCARMNRNHRLLLELNTTSISKRYKYIRNILQIYSWIRIFFITCHFIARNLLHCLQAAKRPRAKRSNFRYKHWAFLAFNIRIIRSINLIKICDLIVDCWTNRRGEASGHRDAPHTTECRIVFIERLELFWTPSRAFLTYTYSLFDFRVTTHVNIVISFLCLFFFFYVISCLI